MFVVEYTFLVSKSPTDPVKISDTFLQTGLTHLAIWPVLNVIITAHIFWSVEQLSIRFRFAIVIYALAVHDAITTITM